MPAPLDLAIAALIAVLWPAWEHFVVWPRFMRSLERGEPVARLRIYLRTFVTEWAMSLAALFVWVRGGHAWSALPLWAAAPWRIAVGAVLVLVLAWFSFAQLSRVRRSPKARAAVRRALGKVEPIVPHTARELGPFLALSVTAGICEEWLYRGVLTALLAGWFGAGWYALPAAVLLANVAFGFAHAYQGRTGIVRTGVVGLVMSGIVLATGSLMPAMIVHALVDAGSGLTTYTALTMPDEPVVEPPPAASA